jgi:hypothetical protein
VPHRTVQEDVECTSVVNYSIEEDYTYDWLRRVSMSCLIESSKNRLTVTMFSDNEID